VRGVVAERDAKTNQIVGDPLRFPEGMKAFTAKLHAMGFKFGPGSKR
jgi:hypothetical protein